MRCQRDAPSSWVKFLDWYSASRLLSIQLDDDSLPDYLAQRDYHGQPSPLYSDLDIAALLTTESGTRRVAQHKSGTGTTPPIKTAVDCRNENTF